MDWYTKGYRAQKEIGHGGTTVPISSPALQEYMAGWEDARLERPRHRPKLGSGGFVDRLVEDFTDRELLVFRMRFVSDPAVLAIVDEEITWRRRSSGDPDRCK